jgi:hypothetical protein
MLLSQASAATSTSLIDTISISANVASGAGKWLDVRPYDGEILVIQNVGVLTGTNPTVAGKLQTATDANGTSAADISGSAYTSVSSNNNVQALVLDPKKLAAGFIGYSGTLGGTAGPTALVSVVAAGKKHVV